MLHLFSKLVPTAFAVNAATELVYKFPGQEGKVVADPGVYINTIFTFALGVVGLLALGFLVYGGIRYILSAGNPSALADARSRMLSALIGVGILAGSYLILNTIDPHLLDLSIRKLDAVTPGTDINFAVIDALTNDIIKLIKDGNIAAVEAKFEEARKMGLNELRAAEGDTTSKDPSAMAKYFMTRDPGQQKLIISRAAANKQGAVGYDRQSEYAYSQMIQLVPNETIFALYPALSPDAQQDLLAEISDPQRQAFYWRLGESKTGGSPQQQEAYLSNLTDFYRARLYLDFQDGQDHDLQLARQIAKLDDPNKGLHEVAGTWAALPAGKRRAFLKQVKDTGWHFTGDDLDYAADHSSQTTNDFVNDFYNL